VARDDLLGGLDPALRVAVIRYTEALFAAARRIITAS
jgi:hypothetical protein